jgi:hypothetical protein
MEQNLTRRVLIKDLRRWEMLIVAVILMVKKKTKTLKMAGPLPQHYPS